MVIHFSKTTRISNPGNTIWDYPMPSKDIGISFQNLHGRGPQKGKYLNTICHEIYFIIDGTGTFHFKDKVYSVAKNDVIIAEPNVAYYIEAENLVYITITRPGWYEEQYKEIDQ